MPDEIVLSGMVGPQDDGHQPGRSPSPDEAADQALGGRNCAVVELPSSGVRHPQNRASAQLNRHKHCRASYRCSRLGRCAPKRCGPWPYCHRPWPWRQGPWPWRRQSCQVRWSQRPRARRLGRLTRFGRDTLAAVYETARLTFAVRRAELLRRAAGAGLRGSRADVVGRSGRTGSVAATLAWPANDRCAVAGDPSCAAITATAGMQLTTTASPASTETPVRKRTSSSQAYAAARIPASQTPMALATGIATPIETGCQNHISVSPGAGASHGLCRPAYGHSGKARNQTRVCVMSICPSSWCACRAGPSDRLHRGAEPEIDGAILPAHTSTGHGRANRPSSTGPRAGVQNCVGG